jgi:hypothetical protein
MRLKNQGDSKSKSLKITQYYKNNVLILKQRVRNSLIFYAFFHRTGPSQIDTPQGFPPGGTSSASQARHLLLGRRLQCVQNLEIKSLPRARGTHKRRFSSM